MAVGDYPRPCPYCSGLPARAVDPCTFTTTTWAPITTERRLFAAMLMQGMLSNSAMCQECNGSVGDWRKRARTLTQIANIHADTLIAELDKPVEEQDTPDVNAD